VTFYPIQQKLTRRRAGAASCFFVGDYLCNDVVWCVESETSEKSQSEYLEKDLETDIMKLYEI